MTIKIATLDVESVNGNGNNGRSKASDFNDIKREAMNQPHLQKIMDELSDAKVVDIKVQIDKT